MKDDIELVPAPGASSTYVSVLNIASSGKNELTFDIKGLADTSTDDTIDPKIILRQKSKPDNILATLNVRVLLQRTIEFDVFYVPDINGIGGGEPPSLKAIETSLNEAFAGSAHIKFVAKKLFDKFPFRGLQGGNLDYDPEKLQAMYDDSIKHYDSDPSVYRIFIVRHIQAVGDEIVGFTAPGGAGGGANASAIELFDADGGSSHALELHFFPHEAGRVMGIPTFRSGAGQFDKQAVPIEEFKDDGLTSDLTDPLMGNDATYQTPWIRQQDWIKANHNADSPPFKK